MDAWTRLRGLYAIVDPEHCRSRDPIAVAERILTGGCAVLQLRAKRLADAELEALARQIGALCRARGVLFVVNDRPQIAMRAGADGVHLGQRDQPIEQARALCGDRLAIGVSTHDLAQARDAARRGADLIGFGPVFATASKRDPDPVVGVHGLREVCAAVSIPVVAIGGIALANAAEVAGAGVQLGAAIAALCGAEDPCEAAHRLHAALGGARGERDRR
jgi:thiamine-phosphate diphosphorylase